MSNFSPPDRGSDPLHVMAMALALVAASVFGAALGFVFDLKSDAPAEQTSEENA